MERSHTLLSVWLWAAYLVASQTPGMSAVQFQWQLGLTRYESASASSTLRAGMVRPDQDRIGGRPKEYVEVDETWVGGRRAAKAGGIEVRHGEPGTAQDERKDGRYAGRVRLAIAADRGADSLCGFVENAVMPGSPIVTDDWSGYGSLSKAGLRPPCNCRMRRTRSGGTVHSDGPPRLLQLEDLAPRRPPRCEREASMSRFNRRFYPFNAFRSPLAIAGGVEAPPMPTFIRARRRTLNVAVSALIG